MKKIFLGVVLLLILILVTGCKKTIAGKWKSVDPNDEYYFIFNRNKTCSYEMATARLDCTYEADDTNITIKYNGSEKANIYEYYFEEKNLTIKDEFGKEHKFVKAK